MDVDLGQSPKSIQAPSNSRRVDASKDRLFGRLEALESHLPRFLRRSTSPLETSPASMSASMQSCGSARPLRSMQFRSAALSNPYSLQYLRYASAQKFFSASVIFLGSAWHKDACQQTARPTRKYRVTLFFIRSLLQSRIAPTELCCGGFVSSLAF